MVTRTKLVSLAVVLAVALTVGALALNGRQSMRAGDAQRSSSTTSDTGVAAPQPDESATATSSLPSGGQTTDLPDDSSPGSSAPPEVAAEMLLADGSPAPGYDPANQPQTSLLEAAGQPNGVAAATGTPREPNPVTSDSAQLNGCDSNYGDAGQCVPLVPPHAQHGGATQWTCPDLSAYFPDGVTVAGTDALLLDGNGDGTACGIGD